MVALVAGVFVAVVPISAQQPVLDASEYGQWERLGTFELDPSGTWLVSRVTRVDGDGALRLVRADGTGEPVALDHGSDPAFSPDGRWLAYAKGVSQEERDEAEEPPADRLGLVDLASAHDSVHFDVRSFAFRDDGAWLASLGVPASDSVGADLVVLDPESGARTVIGNVDSYAWQHDGPFLAATLRTASGSSNGVVLFHPDAGTLRTVDSGDARYRALTWADDGPRLAVLRSVASPAREEDTHDVLVWDDVFGGEPRILDSLEDVANDLRVTPYDGIRFSEDGATVFVGVRPWEPRPDAEGALEEGGIEEGETEPTPEDEPREAPEGDGAPGLDDQPGQADVQVWHWDDDRILRAQEYAADRLSRRTMTAAWHLDDDRFVVLGRDLEEPVTLVDGGRWGLVPDYDPYRFERRFGSGAADWYRVDASSGERTLVAEGLQFAVESRFEGPVVLYYDDDRWTALDVETGAETVVGDGSSFTRSLEDYDYPGPRPSWGVGGWVEGSREVLLYDAHDVWLGDLGDGSLRRLTDGAGDGRRYRIVDPSPEERRGGPLVVERSETVWLSVFDQRTKASGYASMLLDGEPVERVFEDARVTGLRKAADAPRFAFRMERWDDSPDVFVGDGTLDSLRQVTDTNPFQGEYAWGRTELLDYTTDAGHELQAILVYPADFREGERYPLILYQYERLSDNLHVYDVPSERDYYNFQAWSQQGYFVLMPDIVYEPGRPGPSALDAVEHALDAAVATGHVDDERMGLIGHSWGGYQASYLPTRTDRFAASVAGAAITNFLSFMGAVHWNGGLPETGHWETGQARMAVPYWDDLDGHLESSPANFITDLDTPMLLMHGDADGVVDFYQGLEFYNYARRAGKEVVLLVYPGADHGLSDEAQQVDYHRRILEWFGHYLKGEPAPKWITEGESWEERARRIGS